MSRQTIQTDKAPAAVGTYSQAVKVGNTVYISGQLGFDPDTMELREGFEAQAKQVFENIKAICTAAGGTINDVVKFNVSLTDLNDFAALNEVFIANLTEPYPARAAVQVAALPKGGVVEIESIMFIE
ncbi:Rid family detoxifying hydrolase [Psychrobacter sp. M13]|uniref:Rid family detoxifying hydrolase n=1 Tax=Psychrobacter sp. M13 TaxID=3067275 RepID=UPI001918475B|nr:Rid family detoxifying hydrolase [Psychrobacter sp. M13]WLP94015.1 Rid family detoxifying hydrolase [Psychrobacter sp. M13]